MKAFEEWTNTIKYWNPEKYKGAKDAWKAALKRVLKAIIKESNGPSNPKDLMDWINEELEQ